MNNIECDECGKKLKIGEYYIITPDNEIICSNCYDTVQMYVVDFETTYNSDDVIEDNSIKNIYYHFNYEYNYLRKKIKDFKNGKKNLYEYGSPDTKEYIDIQINNMKYKLNEIIEICKDKGIELIDIDDSKTIDELLYGNNVTKLNEIINKDMKSNFNKIIKYSKDFFDENNLKYEFNQEQEYFIFTELYNLFPNITVEDVKKSIDELKESVHFISDIKEYSEQFTSFKKLILLFILTCSFIDPQRFLNWNFEVHKLRPFLKIVGY